MYNVRDSDLFGQDISSSIPQAQERAGSSLMQGTAKTTRGVCTGEGTNNYWWCGDEQQSEMERYCTNIRSGSSCSRRRGTINTLTKRLVRNMECDMEHRSRVLMTLARLNKPSRSRQELGQASISRIIAFPNPSGWTHAMINRQT